MVVVNPTDTKLNDVFKAQQDAKGLLVPLECINDLVTVYAKAFTRFLSLKKTPQTPYAIEVSDLKGNMIIAAVVNFEPAEDASEDAIGNWEYFWTWNKDAIPENAVVSQITDTDVNEMVGNTGLTNPRKVAFTAPQYIVSTAIDLFSLIKSTLDQSAIENDEYIIEVEGIMRFGVSVENGEKVFSAVPQGQMKSLLKADDAATAK